MYRQRFVGAARKIGLQPTLRRRTSRRAVAVLAATVAAALSVSGCNSSTASSGPTAKLTATAKPGAPITLGVLTSLTGSLSSGFTTVENGVKARLAVENANGGVNGHQLKYVMADDASSPTGAVSAVQKLIQQDHVYGILDNSAFFAAAAKATETAGIPVSGVSFDGGPEWHDPAGTNLFDAYGLGDLSKVSTTYGTFFKSQGATKLAVVAYDNPSSSEAGKSAMESAVQAGLTNAYINTKVPLGSTDVGPIIQQIKASGADALYMPTVPNTAFAIVVGLKQAGVNLKAVVTTTGYGGDLLKSPDALAAGEGVDFESIGAPAEANTPATQAFQKALAQYAGSTDIPSFGEYIGWLTADLFIAGLKLAGPTASAADFSSKLRASTWDGAGLEKPENFADPVPAASGLGSQNCVNILKLTSGKFVPIPGAVPVCGTIIPGLSVSYP
jgi:branched-chain amino acid transport system substrate-binding protein